MLQYSATDLAKLVKEMIELKVREGVMKPREGFDLHSFYESVLNGYAHMDAELPVFLEKLNTIGPVATNAMNHTFGVTAVTPPLAGLNVASNLGSAITADKVAVEKLAKDDKRTSVH